MSDSAPKTRLIDRWRALWKLAKNERAEPHQVGLAVFTGVFIGVTPLIGVHGWAALGAASAFRLNRLYAWLGSRISNVLLLPFIVYAEIQSARYARTGSLVSFDRAHALEQAPHLLLDWCIGTFIVGIPLGAAVGLIAYAIAKRQRATNNSTPDTPSESPAPSSGSRA